MQTKEQFLWIAQGDRGNDIECFQIKFRLVEAIE